MRTTADACRRSTRVTIVRTTRRADATTLEANAALQNIVVPLYC